MGCCSSHAAVLPHDGAPGLRELQDACITNQASVDDGQPTGILSDSSVGKLVLPSVTTETTDPHPAALSARSIGFNETYSPIKLLGKGTYGKVSSLELHFS